MSSKTQQLIQDHDAQWVDLRFTDLRGKEQHVTLPGSAWDKALFENGFSFDGSSIAGWKEIHQSDMLLMPVDDSAVLDPFTEESTVNLRCNVAEPTGKSGIEPYECCPRHTALRAEEYLRGSGIADQAFFGPEPEFFVFDDVRWKTSTGGSFYAIRSDEGHWQSGDELEEGNIGHRPAPKGGYFPVPPVDSLFDLRCAISKAASEMGLVPELHHHEVATGGQSEIGMRFSALTQKADELQIFKYCALNIADSYGKTATFMPKPLLDDNGNGMHCHQSLFKDGENLFAGELYAGLSQIALYYIGGIFRHARALNAFANATTNSYRRLVPGFEAPIHLAYSGLNRSAAVRIPYVDSVKARRIEVRFPDASGNSYLCFAALLMAGLDGIKNKIDPGAPEERNLYDPNAELSHIPTVATDLRVALDALHEDRAFLTDGGVFSETLIDSYIDLKTEEADRLQGSPHPAEFEMYYSA